MDEALRKHWMMAQQDRRISEAIEREKPRLRNFIAKRVADQSDAEDILQEVFYELVEAYRMMRPVEQVTAWLFRVARNRITDLFRSKKREASSEPAVDMEDGEEPSFTHAEETRRQIRREERKKRREEQFKIAKDTCNLISLALLLLS